MESMEALIKFLRNQFRDGFFNGKLLNPRDVSEPIADAIKYGAELNAKIVESSFGKMSEDEGAISKEIKKELKDGVDRIVKAKLAKESVDFLNKLEFVKGEQGEPGEDGHTPTKEELIPIIKPLIPEPIPGKPGKDYILTVKDKKEIAKSIKVPVVEKVVETIIKEQPIVTNEIVEKAVSDKPEEIVNKLQSLDGDNRLDASAIKGLEKISTEGRKMYGKAVKYLSNLLDVSIASPTNNQVLKYNSTTGKWENGTVSGGSGTPGGSDTQVQFNDGGAFGGEAGFTYNKTTDTVTVSSANADAIVQAGDNEVNIGASSDDAVNIVGNNQVISTFSGWEYGAQVLQQWWGDKTILLVSAPSASPEESTVTTMLDLGSGNKEWVDWTIEDYAGVDHKASINIAKAGTGTIVPFVIRTWDQDAGTVAAVGKEYFTITPSSEVVINESSQDVNFRVEGDTEANLIFADAGTGRVAIGNNAPAARLHVTDVQDSSSVQAAIFEGNRATPATNDQVYASFKLSDSAGNQDEFVRITARATDVTSTSEDARLGFSLIEAGSLTDELYLTASALTPATSAGLNLGNSTEPFSNVFLAAGAGVNMGNGDVTVNNPATNVLRFSGASSGFEFTDGPIIPVTSDGVALGTTTKMFSDLFLASGAVINFNSGNATITHSAGLLTSNVDIAVPDEAYDATAWNGSLEVPTKNAVRDKIESMLGSSGITRTVVVTSGSATMGSSASTDYVYFVTGAHTMSLPAAAGNTNRYTVKNNHSANITIDTAGAETVEGAASISIAPEESVDFLSNGTNWFVI